MAFTFWEMKKLVTAKGMQQISIITVLGIIVLCLIVRYGPAGRQMRNLEKAKEYAEQKLEQIHEMSEFTAVVISEFYGMNGALLVRGYVRNEEIESELKKLIYTDDLPTEVRWNVQIVGDDNWDAFIASCTGSNKTGGFTDEATPHP